ncbi:MAG: choice-of-anchor J domain-containing protein [Flavobacteriales bacterium]
MTNNSSNTEEFETDVFPGSCWTTLDADNNGQSWSGNIPVTGYNSSHCVLSYNLGENGEDNYLVSPQLTPLEGEHLTWYVSTASENDLEHYQVLISTTGNDVDDFTTILFEETAAGTFWNYRAVDLASYWGMTVHIAFRHNSSNTGIILKLDEIQYPTWTNENQDCSVAVAENFETPIFIYPNPAHSNLYIGRSNDTPIDILRIYDAAGILVLEEKMFSSSQVDISSLCTGYYMLQIIAVDGMQFAFSFMKTTP